MGASDIEYVARLLANLHVSHREHVATNSQLLISVSAKEMYIQACLYVLLENCHLSSRCKAESVLRGPYVGYYSVTLQGS